MKLMFRLLFSLIVLLTSTAQGQSQTLKILDLSVYPAIEVDAVTGSPLDTSIVSYNLDFKVNDASSAATVRMLFGTAQNTGDILDNTATIVLQGGQYSVLYSGVNYPINGYSTSIKVNLTNTQDADYNYITLFLFDNLGQESNRLYFSK